jgi:cytoskeletal protein CcmA (bactofilin family)
MSLAPETTEPKPAAGTNRPPGRSVLAADLRIVGDLYAEGAVEIMGEVEGSVKARTLMLAQDGRLSGTVSAETVELKGQMQGAVNCQSLTLRSAATVQADIVYATLAIESGAQIDGTFRKPKA